MAGSVGDVTADEGRFVTSDDWTALVQRTLRGRGLDELSSVTRDGIEVRPLYADGPAPPAAVRAAADPRRVERGWDIRPRLRVVAGTGGSAADSLRHRIDDDLAGGATSVELDAGEGVTLDDLDRVLAGVDLAETPVTLAPHADLGAARALSGLAAGRGGALAAGSSLGLDPAGEWARSGRIVDCAGAAAWVAESAGASVGLEPGVRAFTVDATRYADAGATEAQALGWATATGVAYLRALVEAGLPVDAAAGLIGFRLAATADQFVTIAALRAARVVWSRVVTASGGSQAAARQYQHAVTAAHTYSRRDPWVNLLRGAAAALAAGAAGADAVTVLAFDHAAGALEGDSGDALGRRLARNTQVLLLEESHMARTGDPAGGSFYVESLTDGLAQAGWGILQSTEAAGGIGAVTADGSLEAAIEKQWETRLAALSTRREPLTGVSEYPLLEDTAVTPDADDGAAPDADDGAAPDADDGAAPDADDGAAPDADDGAAPDADDGAAPDADDGAAPDADDGAAPDADDGAAPDADDGAAPDADDGVTPDADDGAAPSTRGLPVRRLAQPFEDLRDAADRHRLATGERPAMWVAALGPAAAHSDRTAWVKNLLAVGGIEAQGGEGVDSPIAAVADFAASGLAAAVITGSDDWYRRRGPATASALSEAGAALVAVACDPETPADLLVDLQAAGVSDLWHQGTDIVAALKRLHDILGIADGSTGPSHHQSSNARRDVSFAMESRGNHASSRTPPTAADW